MRRGAHHGEHVRFGDEFDGHWDSVLPGSQRLVVGRRDEPAVLVAECDGVDGAKVVVVFLHHLAASCVVLQDLLVAHAG